MIVVRLNSAREVHALDVLRAIGQIGAPPRGREDDNPGVALTAAEKGVLFAIVLHSDKTGTQGARLGVDRLAATASLGRNTVLRALRSLADRNLVEVTRQQISRRGNLANAYAIPVRAVFGEGVPPWHPLFIRQRSQN